MIVTGDRDAFQLIDPDSRVKVMATSRGITETKLYDHQAVVDRYGIPPELIPDFYGLKGDTSDNIPGVPGIGDKTASQLLQQFGALEDVLASVDQISGAKRKENLVQHADDARVSKRLATVQRDVTVDVDPAHEAAREPDRSRLREVFREFELRDPLRRLEEALGSADAAAPAPVATTSIAARVREGPCATRRPSAGATPRPRWRCSRRRCPRASCCRPSRSRASGWPPARRCWSGSAPGADELVRRDRRAAGRSPTTPRRWARCRRSSPTTRCSAPTCSSPPGAASRSARSARSAGSRPTSRTRRAATPCSSRR